MKPVVTFQKQPRHFWVHVKLLSEGRGYSLGGNDEVLFGREVLIRWSEIVKSWLNTDHIRPDLHPTSPKVLREKQSKLITLWGK